MFRISNSGYVERDETGVTVFHRLAAEHNTSSLVCLAQLGVDVNTTDKQYLNALDYAVIDWQDEEATLSAVAYLCALGVKPRHEALDVARLDTALHWAAHQGFMQVVVCLLQYGAHPSIKATKRAGDAHPDGISAEDEARQAGYISIADMLARVEMLYKREASGTFSMPVADVLQHVHVTELNFLGKADALAKRCASAPEPF